MLCSRTRATNREGALPTHQGTCRRLYTRILYIYTQSFLSYHHLFPSPVIPPASYNYPAHPHSPTRSQLEGHRQLLVISMPQSIRGTLCESARKLGYVPATGFEPLQGPEVVNIDEPRLSPIWFALPGPPCPPSTSRRWSMQSPITDCSCRGYRHAGAAEDENQNNTISPEGQTSGRVRSNAGGGPCQHACGDKYYFGTKLRTGKIRVIGFPPGSPWA